MENNNNVKACSGDCLMCSMQQRIYCSAQISRNMFEMINDTREAVERLEAKVIAMQTPMEETLLNPMVQKIKGTEEDLNYEAQEDGGAENRPSI